MKKFKEYLQKRKSFLQSDLGQIIFLLFASLLAHGLFIPWLGLYGDDWSLLWLSYKAGSTNLFFPTNRFIQPYFYSFFTYFLDPVAWQWHILFFIIRFVSVLNLWMLLRTLWPNKKRIRIWVSLLFALYPGSLITYQPVAYWATYFQFSVLFASFWLMLVAIKDNGVRWGVLILSASFAVLNLYYLEYLYFLELLRIPILITYFLHRNYELNKYSKKILKISIPFLTIFLIVSINRIFVHKDATGYFRVNLENYVASPFAAIQFFSTRAIIDGIKSGLLAWFAPLTDSKLFIYSGSRSTLIFSFIACFLTLVIAIFINLAFGKSEERKISITAIFLGVLALIFGEAPLWLAELPIDIGVANSSRFSIPSAIGSAFLLYGLVTLLLNKNRLSNILLSIFCGSAFMMHLLSGNFFRKEWDLQNRFYWQIAWRMPDVEQGTTFIANELPFWTIGENSISAVLNWIYMEDSSPTDHIDYHFYYEKERFLRHFPEQKDTLFKKSHQAGIFSGNSSKLVAFWYKPPACLHIINEKWDKFNPDFPGYLRELAGHYPNEFIRSQGNSEVSLKNNPIFLEEQNDNFCYVYQKASLAAENENWDEVIDLMKSKYWEMPKINHASEHLPFIQALAYKNRYDDAFTLSHAIINIQDNYKPLICNFWNELNHDDSLDKETIKSFIETDLSCD